MNSISQQHHGSTYVLDGCLLLFVKERRRGEGAQLDTFEGQRNSSKCPKAGEVVNELANLENLDIFELIFERNFYQRNQPKSFGPLSFLPSLSFLDMGRCTVDFCSSSTGVSESDLRVLNISLSSMQSEGEGDSTL